MIRSEILLFPRENGERQRVQLVRPESWESLRFFSPEPEPERAFARLTALYREYIVPRYPWLYGRLVFFRLPQGVPVPGEPDALGKSARLTLAAEILRTGLTVRGGLPRFLTPEAKRLFTDLADAGCACVISGRNPFTYVLPVADTLGFLSASAKGKRLAANLSFFLMDPLDCATAEDHIGAPVGLRVKNGVIESPPQYGRPALIVKKDGSVCVDPAPKVRFSVNGCPLGPLNEHVRFPAPKSKGKTVLTIAGGRIAKVSSGSRIPVPTSGFTAVLPKNSVSAAPGDPVSMSGMEDVLFGVQVGPAAVTGGRPVTGVPEPFWHIKRIPSNLLTRRAPYPPALYLYDPEKDRAPRMVLGADGEGRPMLLWFEGAAKHGHVPGEDSCGASLKEAAEVCVALGMTEGVHLDGGGSAQILLDGRRSLFISDRDRADHTEAERAVPTGLCVE